MDRKLYSGWTLGGKMSVLQMAIMMVLLGAVTPIPWPRWESSYKIIHGSFPNQMPLSITPLELITDGSRVLLIHLLTLRDMTAFYGMTIPRSLADGFGTPSELGGWRFLGTGVFGFEDVSRGMPTTIGCYAGGDYTLWLAFSDLVSRFQLHAPFVQEG